MRLPKTVLRAFVGKGLIKLRIKNSPYYIYIDFGEIWLPPLKDVLARKEKIESKFACKIVDKGSYIAIIPSIVENIIEKDGALCMCEEHAKLLSNWLNQNFVLLLRNLLH